MEAENNFNSLEQNSNEQEQDREYLKTEMFENLDLPEVIPPYEGKGMTSYKSSYNGDKMKYLLDLDIDLSDCVDEGGVKDESILLTKLITLRHILILGKRDQNGFDISEAIRGKNRELYEKRVDKYGNRVLFQDGKRLEDDYKAYGLNTNPTRQVSNKELHGIVQDLIGDLSK